MDYLGWELERQRAALAALLLGGGRPEEEKRLRDGETRRADGDGFTARETAADETAGRGENPGAWEALAASQSAVRRASRDRSGTPSGARTPVSAWERILGAEVKADRVERSGRDGGPAAPESSGWVLLEETMEAPERETGVWAREPEALTERGQRKLARETAGRRLESSEDGTAGDAPGMMSGGEPAGDRAAVRGMGRTWAARRGPAERPGEAEAPFGTSLWGGRGSAALEAERDARAVSRAVQRDARRYDGGFFIY